MTVRLDHSGPDLEEADYLKVSLETLDQPQ